MLRVSRVLGRLIVFASVLLFFERPAAADTIPLQINFQGHLRDTAGFLLSGSRDVTFRIYAAPTGGAPLWSEVQTGVPVQGGLFSVLLGSAAPILSSTFDGSTRYLGVEIAGDTGEMSPRLPLVSVPYAYHAHEADTALRAGMADTAIRSVLADSAVMAGLADLATRSINADSSLTASLLGGQNPSFFLNSANFIGTAWTTLTSGGNADALHTHVGGGTAISFTTPQGAPVPPPINLSVDSFAVLFIFQSNRPNGTLSGPPSVSSPRSSTGPWIDFVVDVSGPGIIWDGANGPGFSPVSTGKMRVVLMGGPGTITIDALPVPGFNIMVHVHGIVF